MKTEKRQSLEIKEVVVIFVVTAQLDSRNTLVQLGIIVYVVLVRLFFFDKFTVS